MRYLSPKAKLAMKAAWEMARKGQRIYGGQVRQYLREALRLAWADVKADPVTRAADDLIAHIRATRNTPPAVASAYLARYAGSVHRRIWADNRL